MFWGALFPRAAQVYADLLMKRLKETGAEAYLVNTGWSGGAYRKGGERFSIPVTRAVVKAITEGELNHATFKTLPGFNIQIPTHINGVDDALLDPRKTYASRELYEENLAELVHKFQENFKKFDVSQDIQQSGPEC